MVSTGQQLPWEVLRVRVRVKVRVGGMVSTADRPTIVVIHIWFDFHTTIRDLLTKADILHIAPTAQNCLSSQCAW